MGLFHKQKKSDDAVASAAQEAAFLDANFREELRNHARLYFDTVLTENGTLFKQELDAVVEDIKTELKTHVVHQLSETLEEVSGHLKTHLTTQFDEQFKQHQTVIQEAQARALEDMKASAEKVGADHRQLVAHIGEQMNAQQTMLGEMLEAHKTDVATAKQAQDQTLSWLKQSADLLGQQYQELHTTLAQQVKVQEDRLVGAFESNMAQIIEQYVTAAIGDQYDLKAQLPAIIQNMEAKKQAMTDDMKV